MASNKSLEKNTTQRPPTALERIGFIEQKLFREIYPMSRNAAAQLKSADKILAALIEITEETVGAGAVSARIVAIRSREVEAEVQAQEEAFAEAVKNGDLVTVPSSQKTDLLISISQTDPEGNPRGARLAFAPITGYTPDVQAAFAYDAKEGKLTRELQVGEVVDVKDAEGAVICKVKVEALYEPVVKAEEPAEPTGLVDPSGNPVASEPAAEAVPAAEAPTETAAQ